MASFLLIIVFTVPFFLGMQLFLNSELKVVNSGSVEAYVKTFENGRCTTNNTKNTLVSFPTSVRTTWPSVCKNYAYLLPSVLLKAPFWF
jgi:hypothetical protein